MPFSLTSLIKSAKTTPLVRAALVRRYERRFSGDAYGAFRGVYSSFDEARRTSPSTKPAGFDAPGYSEHHVDRMGKVLPYDYPVLFWLNGLIKNAQRVFDLGGNVGVHYYGYRKYLPYPDRLQWSVCELPTLVAEGKRIQATRDAPHLSFTESFDEADGTDILVAAGVLQYIDKPSITELLASLKRKPQHLFLNKLPLHVGPRFVTLQNAGVTFLPQHVFNRRDFLGSLAQLGYEVVDSWDVPGFSCVIPFHPNHAVWVYSGLYLRHSSS